MKNKFQKGQMVLFMTVPFIVTAVYHTSAGYHYMLDYIGILIPEFQILPVA